MISMSHCPITPASPASGIASACQCSESSSSESYSCVPRRACSGAKSCTSMPPRWTPMPRGRDSIAPRFYVEEHLDELFTGEELPNLSQEEDSVATGDAGGSGGGDSPVGDFYKLPSADDEVLIAENAAKDDWISRNGRQRREQKGV